VVPALAQAARATCRLGKGAAILRWCFLTKIFGGGPFCHFIGTGGLEFLTEEITRTNEMAKETTSKIICQKRSRFAFSLRVLFALFWAML
jgi:hypothetical protein